MPLWEREEIQEVSWAVRIQKTTKEELSILNAIISRSKSFWNYDEAYLKEAIPLIQITESWIDQHEGYSIYCDQILCGFMGIEKLETHWKLEHLWIDPVKIKQGLGAKALSYLLKIAKDQNIKIIYLLPDPPAEGFYKKLGAQFTGKTIHSRVINGPSFREMQFILCAANPLFPL